MRRENDFSEVTQFYARYVNGTLLSKATINAVGLPIADDILWTSRHASKITYAKIGRRFRKFLSQ